MAVPLLDLSRQYEYLQSKIEKAVLEVLSGSQFILGPPVSELEKKIAKLSGVKHGIGVASGTDALMLALRAAGVGLGDEVITTDFSFFATAGVVSRLGATPVFVDIQPDTYNIDPNLIEEKITNRTKVIMPVHLFGQIADMDRINEIAKKYKLIVIEDAAQSIGAMYKGKPAGSMSDYGCYSFYPTKNLGGAGDGGMIVTNSETNSDCCRMLRVHGQSGKYEHAVVGYNSRLASIQAAVLLVKLEYLKGWSEKRIEHANFYNEAFKDIDGLTTPYRADYSDFHIYNQYTLASARRARVFEALQKARIGHCVYYPIPFHLQTCFADLGYDKNDCPVSSKAAGEVFSIPVFPELTQAELEEVVLVIKKALA